MHTNPWIAVVGTRDAGRPDITRRLTRALHDRAIRVTGFVSEPRDDGSVDGYDLVELPGGARRPLARSGPNPRLCRWEFDDAAFAEVARRVAADDAEVVVLQLGTLEAAGDGFWDAVVAALAGPARLVVLAIRPHVLARVVDRLPDPADAIELPASDDEVGTFVDRVVARITG